MIRAMIIKILIIGIYLIFLIPNCNVRNVSRNFSLVHHSDKALLMTHGVAMGDANGLYVEFEHVASQQDVGGPIS